MKISTKGVYALEAVIDLTMNLDQGLVTIRYSRKTESFRKIFAADCGRIKKGADCGKYPGKVWWLQPCKTGR